MLTQTLVAVGGGLFDSLGNLLGITTLLQDGKTIAISLDSINKLNKISLNDKDKYTYCEEGYITKDNKCLQYCKREQTLGKDEICYDVCENFCESEEFNVDYPECSKGLIPGSDQYCHKPCESPDIYCTGNSYCYKNRCVSCSVNTLLFKDGTCRFYE